MTYKMKKQRPVRRGKLLAPKQVTDLQLVVRVFCETNDAHEAASYPEDFGLPRDWDEAMKAAIRLRLLLKNRP